MAFHQRDIVSAVSSFNSFVNSALNVPPISTSETIISSKAATTTASSSPSTTSAKLTSTAKSTASSTNKSAAAASSSTDSAAASTITSASSTASISSTSTTPFPSISSPSPTSSITSPSSKIPTSTQVTTTTATPSPPSTVLPSSSSASGNEISTAGVAVAAVFAVLIIAGILYLLWKYLPACRRRRERAYLSRSHRDGLPYAGPRKGLAFTDEEASDLHLDNPQLGLGLRKYDFHTSPTCYPGQPQQDADGDLSQRRPLTNASEEHDIVSSLSTRSVRSQFSQSTLPSALQAGTPIYPFPQHCRYQDVRPSQIGMAVGSTSGGSMHEMQGGSNGNERPGSGGAREKGLPPLPLPSIGYGKAFS